MTRTTRATQVLSLLLVALTMGQLYAHVLELEPKMDYPPELYLRLNNSLYAWYGPPLGAAINTSAVLATGALAWMMRRQPSVRLLTGTAFALQVAALANYFARVEPVNVRFRALSPGQVPSDFIALRAQWEYGHALNFALYAVAFLLLVIALVRLAAQARAMSCSPWRTRPAGCGGCGAAMPITSITGSGDRAGGQVSVPPLPPAPPQGPPLEGLVQALPP